MPSSATVFSSFPESKFLLLSSKWRSEFKSQICHLLGFRGYLGLAPLRLPTSHPVKASMKILAFIGRRENVRFGEGFCFPLMGLIEVMHNSSWHPVRLMEDAL